MRVLFKQSFFMFDDSGNIVPRYESGKDYPASSETTHYIDSGAAVAIEVTAPVEIKEQKDVLTNLE